MEYQTANNKKCLTVVKTLLDGKIKPSRTCEIAREYPSSLSSVGLPVKVVTDYKDTYPNSKSLITNLDIALEKLKTFIILNPNTDQIELLQDIHNSGKKDIITVSFGSILDHDMDNKLALLTNLTNGFNLAYYQLDFRLHNNYYRMVSSEKIR